MRDIWNPWHGCTKCSEGCAHCYMYFLDKAHGGGDSSVCYKTSSFDYPIQKDRRGSYKIKSGESIRVCMSSDFFLADADGWRDDAWELIRIRSDVKFFILTKRPERVREHLPQGWGDGWENVFFNVTCENQKRADERIPIMLGLPFKHKGIMTAPLIAPVSIEKYLAEGQIEQVLCGGENYDGCRVCRYEWVKTLSDECRAADVTFAFLDTGSRFAKDGKEYVIDNKNTQSLQAYKSGLSYVGRPIVFKLTDGMGIPIPERELFVPHYGESCEKCGSRIICAGCTNCGKCGKKE